jgi:hypothetical protein
MSLTDLIPNSEVITSPVSGLPPDWSRLLTMSRGDALGDIADCIGLGQRSQTRGQILGATELAILIPRRKKDSRSPKTWTLAVQFEDTLAMLFNLPSAEMLKTSTGLPASYLETVSRLGACHVNQFSGHLIWPWFVERTAHEIASSITDASQRHIVPFYDHHTGDYDCWLSEDFGAVWCFEHEKCSFRPYTVGGFGEWFDKTFQQALPNSAEKAGKRSGQ